MSNDWTGQKKRRLIDADNLAARIMVDAPDFGDGGSTLTKVFILAMLKSKNITPTVDAVPVIRCKDCKHCEHWYADKGRCFLWHEGGIDVFGDGFCNYGERSEVSWEIRKCPTD